MQLFYIVQKFQWTSTVFFNFRFSSRKSESQQKLAKKIARFTIQFCSLILRTSNYLTLKIICSHNTAKNISEFTNFPVKMFLFGVRRNICTTSCLHCKANVCIVLYISLRNFLFQRCSKVLSDGGGMGKRLNNFLKVACCLGLTQCLQLFISIEIFGNSFIF